MNLQGYEAKAFTAWRDCPEDFSILSFDKIAGRAGMDRSKVRRAVRGLARKGIVEFHRVSWTDDGEICGAGYSLTKLGVELREPVE